MHCINPAFLKKEFEMAITGQNNNAQQAPQAAPQAAPSQSTTMGQAMNNAFSSSGGAPTPPSRLFSLSDQKLFSSGPLSRFPGSEILMKLKDKLDEIFKKSGDPSFEFAFLSLDNNNNRNIDFSTLVLCIKNKNMVGLSYYAYILEGSREPYENEVKSINTVDENGQMGSHSVKILRTTDKTFERTLAEQIRKAVDSAFPNVPVVSSDGTIVPRTFNVDDEKALHLLAVTGGIACYTNLRVRAPDFFDLNLGDCKNDTNLILTTSFDKKTIQNNVGSPVRSDFEVSFRSQEYNTGNTKQEFYNSGNKSSLISQLNGYVDFIFAPVNDYPTIYGNQNPMMMQNPQQMMTMYQKYIARVVITAMRCDLLNTLPTHLMSLLTITTFNEPENWYKLFTARFSNDRGFDLTDIGALNIEANTLNEPGGVGTPVSTKSDTFRLEDRVSFLSTVVRPGIAVSMDVPDCGPETWYQNVFSAAASNAPNSRDANEAIFMAAQTLTNNCFSKYFPQNATILTDLGNRVHLGYYEDSNGVKRDIRDIDYLAVLNRFSKGASSKDIDLATINLWKHSLYNTNIHIEKRLADREKIITTVLGGRVEFTGFATRVTFTKEFLSALAQGCQEAGLRIQRDTIGYQPGIQRRATGSFADSALMGFGQPGQQSVFSGSQQGPVQGNFGSYNRWMR